MRRSSYIKVPLSYSAYPCTMVVDVYNDDDDGDGDIVPSRPSGHGRPREPGARVYQDVRSVEKFAVKIFETCGLSGGWVDFASGVEVRLEYARVRGTLGDDGDVR